MKIAISREKWRESKTPRELSLGVRPLTRRSANSLSTPSSSKRTRTWNKPVNTAGSWNRYTSQPEVRLRHEDLLGFMFFQLAQALLSNRQFRQCSECGKWSLLAPEANRANRITCSDYCRLKRSRKRRSKAFELGQRGWSIQRIAAEIGSKPSTVDQWLAQAKRSKSGRGSK